MTVLDAYAVIAYLRDEPAATDVETLLTGGHATLTTVGVAEVLDHLVRLAGADEETAVLDLAQLGLLDAAPITAETGVGAGALRARHYHRVRRAVSMADCLAAQVARSRGDTLATSDPHLLDLCWVEHVGTVVLRQSDGATWTPPAGPA